VTQGYRKIPTDYCYNGLDLNAKYVSCGLTGAMTRLRSGKSFILVLVGIVLVYYSWAYIEAILIMLPIPDPKGVFEKIGKLFPSRNGQSGPTKGYEKGFDKAPESLDEEDEEELSD
jgi:hypothetical protein